MVRKWERVCARMLVIDWESNAFVLMEIRQWKVTFEREWRDLERSSMGQHAMTRRCLLRGIARTAQLQSQVIIVYSCQNLKTDG